jgi:hypothetical protein
VGDVNSDGLPDVIVGTYEDDIGLFLNNRNEPGQFEPEQVLEVFRASAAAAYWPTSMAMDCWIPRCRRGRT